MAKIQFGEWLPDLPPIGLRGSTKATNVLPHARSYIPFPQLSVVTDALGARCQGAVFATDATSNNYNYAGDATALYALVATSFSDVTRLVGGSYTINSDDYWEFAQWENTLIGVNGFVDLPQRISLGAAAFADLSIGVKAKHIMTMRDFVVLGNISDSATNVYRVRWSAINNPTSFTVDAATLADFQDLMSEGGPVQKLLPGEYGVVLQQRAIWRMQFVGSPLIFQFDPIHEKVGAYASQGAVRYQNLVFFLSVDGFYAFDGSALDPIGLGKVDTFFFADLDVSNFQRIHAAIDSRNKLVVWAYPSSNTTAGNPDKLLVYSWAFKRWTLVEGLNLDFIMQAISTGVTLDGLDSITPNPDIETVSWDSPTYQGGQLILAAFDSTHKLGRFNGSAMAAIVETEEFQLFPNTKATLFEIWPIATGTSASVAISVYNRNTFTESVSAVATSIPINSTGFAPVRSTARYFRIRLETAENVNFTHIIAVDVQGVEDGAR